jgi:hypothetical protein
MGEVARESVLLVHEKPLQVRLGERAGVEALSRGSLKYLKNRPGGTPYGWARSASVVKASAKNSSGGSLHSAT